MLINNTRGSEWIKCDLHMHSNASDGTATPQELVDEAEKQGLTVIALTDHHTVENIDEIKSYAKTKSITVISGVEFRTEYGQKSVHMIGLFPDGFNGTVLNQKELYELILAPLNLTETKIRIAGRSEHPEYDDKRAYKEGLLRVQVDFKKASDLIHKYGGIVSVHAGRKTNSFDEEMKHEGPSAKNVDLIDSLGPVKEELLREYIDICEVRNGREVKFYLETWNKPCIAASDAHSVTEVARNYCWIKGTPSFEGLKQIIFEPSERVKIQEEKPEKKLDYLVIDRVDIDHKDFGKQIIPFNQGLNTIIGGRSSGKSILLSCLARLCGDRKPIKQNKAQYDEYIDAVSESMKLYWRDFGEETNRKIDFFPQSYIIDMASDPSKITELVENIMRDENGENKELTALKGKLEINKVFIHQLFSEYRKKIDELKRLHSDIKTIGNRDGILQEIQKLEDAIIDIKMATKDGLSDEEEEVYVKQNERITTLKQIEYVCLQSIEELEQLSDRSLFTDIDLSFSLIQDDILRSKISSMYSSLKEETLEKWKGIIQSLEGEYKDKITESRKEISSIEENPVYVKANEVYKENSKLVEENSRLEKEKEKLAQIDRFAERIEMVKKDVLAILDDIFRCYREFYDKQYEYCETHIIDKGDVKITPKTEFKSRIFEQNIAKYFDGRSAKNMEVLCFKYKDADSFYVFIKDVLKKTLQNEYVLKIGNKYDDIAETIFSSNPFTIEYNINYQGDDFEKMSEGKTAFVILRLLLDFSTNEYPILIDQPEDDLDNRAIFGDLVKYLREKKIKRQIILVTHNPNIVVGADAEEIIVANQNGIGNCNPGNVKFAYVTGALEDTYQCDDINVLLKQGIREHVCDLLEGGDIAFKLREHKYQLV